MWNDGAILVVGTTADYIEWIERRSRTKAVFLTAQRERERAIGRFTTPEREILIDLNHPGQCLQHVQSYIRSTRTSIVAVACFDDESLPLAATLAKELGVEFPSIESVRRCLDKHVAKQAWQDSGVPCPKALAVSSQLTELGEGGISFPCVLKPKSGSGSEGVFLCHTQGQAHRAVMHIIDPAKHPCADSTAVAEEFISGTEFSCDFAVSNGNVQILRTARKCMTPTAPLGTTLAYIIPAQLSSRMRDEVLPEVLLRATEALGLSRAICMADFIVSHEEVLLLEISPRIGGDCLPHILFEAWGVDALRASMEFSRNTPIKSWLRESAPTVVGLRVFSPGPGKVIAVDTQKIDDDPRIISHHLHDCRGRMVVLPPEDYSSWLLGHVIFQPYAARDTEDQIHELRESIHIHLEDAVA